MCLCCSSRPSYGASARLQGCFGTKACTFRWRYLVGHREWGGWTGAGGGGPGATAPRSPAPFPLKCPTSLPGNHLISQKRGVLALFPSTDPRSRPFPVLCRGGVFWRSTSPAFALTVRRRGRVTQGSAPHVRRQTRGRTAGHLHPTAPARRGSEGVTRARAVGVHRFVASGPGLCPHARVLWRREAVCGGKRRIGGTARQDEPTVPHVIARSTA